MPQAKALRAKSKKIEPAKPAPEHDDEEQEEAVADAPKIKKVIEVDDHEPAIVGDEKLDDDAPVPGDDENLSSDDASLDDEELNPFGDKWEE